jgi:hypothetical protein
LSVNDYAGTMTQTKAAELGISAHPGYADQLPEITTPAEAFEASKDLTHLLSRLAVLELHPRTYAVQLLQVHAEAGEIAEQLRAFLIAFEVPA